MTGRWTTRRGVLALAGGVALAGCGDLRVPGTGPPELDGDAVGAVAAMADPHVPETFPVRLDPPTLAASIDRARALADQVPTPLSPEEVPNGVVRQRMERRVEHANAAVREATDAASMRESLADARSAREAAMSAAAAWHTTEGELTCEDVVAEADELREALSNLRGHVRYLGDDPVRATVVHAVLEEYVEGVASRIERSDGPSTETDGVLGVGELAGRHERARALLAHANRLHARFLDSLDTRRNLGDRIAAAAESSVGELRAEVEERSLSRERDVSSYVGRDVGDTPARWALDELAEELTWRTRQRDELGGQPASALVSATDGFAALAAFDAVRNRVAEGELYRVDDVGDVRARRRAAMDAIRVVREAPTEPSLVAEVVPEIAARVAYADERLPEYGETISADTLAPTVAEYVIAAEKARALPDATGTVADALGS